MSPTTTVTLVGILLMLASRIQAEKETEIQDLRAACGAPSLWAFVMVSGKNQATKNDFDEHLLEVDPKIEPGLSRTRKAVKVPTERLLVLSKVCHDMEKLFGQETVTVDDLFTIYARVARLATSTLPVDKLESAVVSKTLLYTSALGKRILRKDYTTNINMPSVSITLFGSSLHTISNKDERERNLYTENNRVDGFSVDLQEHSRLILNRNAEFVVYQKNSCPLRPLPNWKTPINWYRVVDVFLGDERSPDLIWLPEISLGMDYEKPFSNVRYGCLRWNDTDTTWSTLGCKLVNVPNLRLITGTFRIACFCHMIFNGQFSQYMMYQYENEVHETITIDNLPLQGDNLANNDFNYMDYRRVLEDILLKQDERGENLNKYLSNVTLVDLECVSNETKDAILEDVGKILLALKPDEGRHTRGHRNALLASFVVQSDKTTEGDFPVGFGLYNNYESGIECFMSTEEIDPNVLFSCQMNFSLLFSKSVVQQNSRYAFLVYPPCRFFKPTAYINGQPIMNVRVVDIVLTPNQGKDVEDQFVNLYNGYPTSDNLYDCGYWSSELGSWTTEGCYSNPEFYIGVCTCKMNTAFRESKSRGQFIAFTYVNLNYFNFEELHNELARDSNSDLRIIPALSHISLYQMFPNEGSLSLMFHELAFVLVKYKVNPNYYRLQDSDRKELVRNVRGFILHSAECFNFLEILIVRCSNNDGSLTNQLYFSTATSITPMELLHYISNIDTPLAVPQSIIIGDQVLTLLASESVFTSNSRHAFVIYPKNRFLWPSPSIGQRISSRVVDIILKPRDGTEVVDQFVELTLTRPENHTLGCGVWDDDANEWTTSGCSISTDTCTCSLTAYGGQYVVYTYIDNLVDQEVFKQIVNESFVDTESIFDSGTAIVHNATQLAADTRNIAVILSVYRKMVQHLDRVADGEERIRPAWIDMNLMINRACLANSEGIRYKYQFTSSVQLMSAELTDDMFSNAVLAHGGQSNLMTRSDMAFVAITLSTKGVEWIWKVSRGFLFCRDDSVGIQFAGNSDLSKELKDNPLFAAIITDSIKEFGSRMAFLIYPMNVSPFKYTMTTAPMFNSRQVDVYTKKDQARTSRLEIYFQPTDDPKKYIKTACAVWDERARAWSAEFCTVHLISRYDSCNCMLNENLTVTRIIIYEYTDVPNFSLSYSIKGTGVVYLIGSALSLLGLIIIASTAILFPDWREEVSSKILMQLASSHFMYLVLTMFRETHTIYADMKNLDVTLVVFTVLVHYTRLVHHCWGLVMSVLQYKRFSGVVGASAMTHLLFKVGLFAWGAPLIPLAVLLSWNVREHFCTPNVLTHYMLYLVPVVVITLVNIGLLVAIVRVITNGCGMWNDDELQRHGGSKQDMVLRQLKQTVMMFFLFGIPAVFEMFNDLVFHSVVMVYINKALDPIQGFIMFLFFVVINDKTRGMWSVRVFGDLPATVNRPAVKNIKLKRKVRNVKQTGPKTTPACLEPDSGSTDVKTAGDIFKEVLPEDQQSEDNSDKGDSDPDFAEDVVAVGKDPLRAKKEMYLKILLERYRENEKITALLLEVRRKVRAKDREEVELLDATL